MYFHDKLKKKTSRETGKRERKERERWRKKEWQPFTQTWYMLITWCCVLNTEVLSSQGFLQSHKNMLTNHMVPWNYRFILHIFECIRSINCKKKLEKWKKKNGQLKCGKELIPHKLKRSESVNLMINKLFLFVNRS